MAAERAFDPAVARPRRLDGLPCGIVAFTDDGTVVDANTTLHAMLGYAAGELAGRHVEQLLGLAGRIFYQTHLFPLLRLHGEAREIFLLLRRRDGGDIGALVNAVRRESDGGAVTECVLLEVRERRKYEDALLRARREADEARAAADAHARQLEHANALLVEQAQELELQQQQLQEQAAELEVQGEELQSVNAALQALNDQLQSTNAAVESRTADLERARAVADDANRAKSEFLAVMSHELRTPLNAIGGYAELIEIGIRGPVTPQQVEDLRRIRNSQRHLLGLINEVLNYAKLETGTVEFDLGPVPLREALAGAEALVAPQARAKELLLSVTTNAPDVTVCADVEKLRQILVNLLSNAVKFTDPGGQVAVAARAEPHRIVITVRDTGIGIPPDKLDAIFDPFVQVRSDATRPHEGTGLGLAISRDLAHGMGGDILAESVAGVGSTFTLSLPRA